MDIARLRGGETRQLTTFKPEQRNKTIKIPRGTSAVAGEVQGEGFVAQIWITFPGWFWQHWSPAYPMSQTILKTLILKIYWDGASVPAICAPVSDLAGNGLCRIANFGAKYFGMSSGGFYIKYPMPFRRGFRIEFENADPFIDTEVFVNAIYQLTETAEDAGYLHAHHHTGINSGPEPMVIANTEGRGHYAGCSLAMQGEQRNYYAFLEAPEFVYVDDNWEQPQFYGTGLEDYFQGGWYFREGEFSGATHGVVIKDVLHSSVAMYRIHDADAIVFGRRFRMEFIFPYKSDGLKPFWYSAVSWLYLDAPQGCGPALPADGKALLPYRIVDSDHLSVP